MLLLALAVAAAHGSLQASAPRLPLLRAARPRVAPAVRCQAAEAAAQDLVGDGGVLKTVVRRGDGPSSAHARGSKVEVHYVGTLDTGTVFDSSRQRGKTFKFTLGEGKVIGGWEVGVPSMQVGD
jgi:FKBP-type peptidyl-prolyl cis-trans isomerase